MSVASLRYHDLDWGESVPLPCIAYDTSLQNYKVQEMSLWNNLEYKIDVIVK